MIITGDVREVLKTLPDESVHCCVTSPPYWGLRDYGVPRQIGLEQTPQEYVYEMVTVFREVRRVLRADGTLWLNLGDSYAAGGRGGGGSFTDQRKAWKDKTKVRGWGNAPPGLKPKDLVGIPWRVAFALQEDGWYLRSDIIWHKPNPMPESVTDRPTRAHEYIFLLSKSSRYHYDADAIKEPLACPESSQPSDMARAFSRRRSTAPKEYRESIEEHTAELPTGRNKRSVWTVPTNSYVTSHFATFPEELIQPCILAGCPAAGTVLDPFFGAGTTGLVALRLDRKYIGIELNPDYVKIAEERLRAEESQIRLGLW